jgi:hypothetical protein
MWLSPQRFANRGGVAPPVSVLCGEAAALRPLESFIAPAHTEGSWHGTCFSFDLSISHHANVNNIVTLSHTRDLNHCVCVRW